MIEKLPDFSMDSAGLYREDVFSDQKAGTLRKLTPVTVEGERDPVRAVIFVGQTQVMTAAGALPVTFEMETESLADAVAQFGEKAQQALQQTLTELKEMQRQQASSIVVPGQGGGMPPTAGPGGAIHMP